MFFLFIGHLFCLIQDIVLFFLFILVPNIIVSYYIFWFKVLFHWLHNIEDLLWSFQMEDQEQNGYLLFKKEQANKLKEKGIKVTSIDDHNVEMSIAWSALSEEEKKSYAMRVKVARPEKVRTSKKAAFETHFSLPQFTPLMCYINQQKELKERVHRLGFGNLLDIQCSKLPRDFIVAVLRAYDPPMNVLRIRGKTKGIEAEDVARWLRVPFKGQQVREDLSDNDEELQKMFSRYKNVPYARLVEEIKEGKATGVEFDELFMLCMLGTFLAPTASHTVARKLLKVVL